MIKSKTIVSGDDFLQMFGGVAARMTGSDRVA